MNHATNAVAVSSAATSAESRGDMFGARTFCLALAVLISMAFWDVLSGSQTFFFRDYGIFGYPVAQFHKECFWRGELPLWNPFNCCGIPFLAQWNTLALYPGSLIYLLLPLPWSLSFYCLLHLLLAGAGMYRLAFAWTGKPLAAAVAGMGFALSGLLLNALMWPNNIAALGWMPWVVFAVERGWLHGGRSLLLAILVGAIQMLSGAPEIIIFTWLVLGAVWAGHFWRKTELRRALVVRGAATVLLVAGLVAAQILPFLDLLLHSQRGMQFSDAPWSLPGSGWVHFFLPLFGFYQSPSGVCFQPGQEWTSSYYAGVGIVLLAFVSLRVLRERRVVMLWTIALIGVLLAMGANAGLHSILCKVFPVMSIMRFPVKFAVLAIFAFPLLAAFGVRAMEQKPNSTWSVGSALACIGIIIAALAYAYVRPPTRLPWATLAENGASRIACVLLVTTVLILLSRFNGARALLGGGLIVGLALDALTHVPWQNPTVAPSAYAPGMLETQLKTPPQHGTDRAMMTRRTHDTLYAWMLPDAFNDYCGRRLSIFGNCNVLDNVPTIDGFYSLYLPRQREIWGDLFFAPEDRFPKSLADFVGVSRAVTNLFEWEQRASAMPLASAGQLAVFADEATIRSRVSAPEFDPRQTVLLPAGLAGKISATKPVKARVADAVWKTARGDVTVESDGPALLVVAQSFHHNWRAYVNGKSAEVWRANHAFQALEVPAGRSQVRLVYEDSAFRTGGVVSGASILFWSALWLRQRRGRSK